MTNSKPMTEQRNSPRYTVSPDHLVRTVSDGQILRTKEPLARILTGVPEAKSTKKRKNRSYLIGILVQNIEDPFYRDIIARIATRLRGNGYFPLIACVDWYADKKFSVVDQLLAWQIDALISFPIHTPGDQLKAISAQIPFISIDYILPGMEKYFVSTGNFQGAYKATTHLINLGHTRIAHITGMLSDWSSAHRYEGYCQALHRADLPVDLQLVISGDNHEESGFLAAEELLKREIDFTAVFAGNDQIAYGINAALHKHNISVPADVSIVGFGDTPSILANLWPFTTVRLPLAEIGDAVSENILILIKNEEPAFSYYPPELVVRSSTIVREDLKPIMITGEAIPAEIDNSVPSFWYFCRGWWVI